MLKSVIDDPTGWFQGITNVATSNNTYGYIIEDVHWAMIEVPEPSSAALALLGLCPVAIFAVQSRAKRRKLKSIAIEKL